MGISTVSELRVLNGGSTGISETREKMHTAGIHIRAIGKILRGKEPRHS